MQNGLIVDSLDNVGVAIENIKKGEDIVYLNQAQKTIRLKAADNIPIYHKFATCDIEMNAPIVKYAQHIGQAAIAIYQGQHVHVHNVKSVRENLG
jgi:altronate dehydratase small subunit